MTKLSFSDLPEKSWVSKWGAVFAVLFISLLATFLVWKYEEGRVAEKGQLLFERSSESLKDNIMETMKAYAQFLRGGVGLVHATDGLDRAKWFEYVAAAQLQDNYPGIQGVSINGFLTSETDRAAFLADVREQDWPQYRIQPEGQREAYAPVLFLEPLSKRNARAIGYDIYSEALRRAAVDRAVATGEPALTAKITLIHEGEDGDDIQAGVLLILSTNESRVEPISAADRRANTSGLIVSVFRMGDLIQSVYAVNSGTAEKRVRLRLYDADAPSPDHLMYDDEDESRAALYSRTVTVDVYGRPWTFMMFSTEEFEDDVYSASPQVVLGAGLLLSMLLTSLVLGQSQRAHETELAADKLSRNQEHIELLMGEVNHRSKNLLSLVQAIARQTRADDPGQFVSQFSQRVRALAASQDLLVKNGWKGISLHELVDSQLAHFEGLLGNRIQVNGPDIDVSAEASQTLGMAFHELATNAGKYGALSNSVGMVDIEWRIAAVPNDKDHLEISWVESGGPVVEAPSRKGFGSKVTDMMVKYALDGQVQSLFEPTGFVWRLACTVDRVFEDPSDPISSINKIRETTV